MRLFPSFSYFRTRLALAGSFVLALRATAATAGFTYALPDPAGTINAIAVDAAGDTYLTGSTSSSNFPTTPGAFQTQYGGGICPGILLPGAPDTPPTLPCSEAFVVKLDPSGAAVWAIYLGGVNSNDIGTAISVDAADNVYVAGTTTSFYGTPSADFPTTPGAQFPNQSSNSYGFAAKLGQDGTHLLYGTYLPGLGSGRPNSTLPAAAWSIPRSSAARTRREARSKSIPKAVFTFSAPPPISR